MFGGFPQDWRRTAFFLGNGRIDAVHSNSCFAVWCSTAGKKLQTAAGEKPGEWFFDGGDSDVLWAVGGGSRGSEVKSKRASKAETSPCLSRFFGWQRECPNSDVLKPIRAGELP